MILIQNCIKNLKLKLDNYLLISILSKHLQSSYLVKNFYTFILIFVALFCYLILSTNTIYYFEDSQYFNIIYNTVILFTVLDLFFLKFNLIVRIYFLVFKGIPYYFLESSNLNKLSNFGIIMLHYFIKNILLILLSIYTIYRVSYLLQDQNVILFEFSHFYSNIISIILGILYIENILKKNVDYDRDRYR